MDLNMKRAKARVIVRGLRLARRALASLSGQPVVWGVPIKQGTVFSGEVIALATRAGRTIPAQVEMTATWADGSAKWVLITAPALPEGTNADDRFDLIRAKPAHPRHRLRVSESSRGVAIDTSVLRFTISTTGPVVSSFESRAGKAWKVRAEALDLLMAVESEAARHEGSASRQTERKVWVEAIGPMRGVIAVRGAHRCEDGREFGAYMLRFEVFAGSGRVRLTHSVLFDFDTDREHLRASEIVLNTRVGGHEQTHHGGDDRVVTWPRMRADWAADFAITELFQDSPTHWRLSRWVDPQRRDVFGGEGVRSAGWASLVGEEGSVTAVIRDCWQNHPKSLRIDARAGELRIGLYPRRAEPLNLRRYSGLAYMMTYEAPCQWKPEATPMDASFNALGVRKTHEVSLLFDADDIPADAAGETDRPWLTLSQSDLAASGVILPKAVAPSRRMSEFVDNAIAYLVDARDHAGATGYVDYFDLPLGIDPATDLPLHDFGGLAYINDEGMPCLGLWQAFLLTGRDDALDLARAMARHNADFDSFHTGPYAGLGGRHNVSHWGDQCREPRISQPIGKRFGYLHEGDRSILDLVGVMLDSFQKRWAKPRWANLVSETASILSTLLFAHEIGLGDYDRLLRSLADALAASINEQGLLATAVTVHFTAQIAAPIAEFAPANSNMASCFGVAQSMMELAERYDHEPLRKALVRYARYQMLPRDRRADLEKTGVSTDCENAGRWADLFGYAQMVTGDSAFARHMLRQRGLPRVTFLRDRKPIVIRSAPNPDTTRTDREMAMKYYPLFGGELVGLVFWIGVHLHKVRGTMALEAGERRKRIT